MADEGQAIGGRKVLLVCSSGGHLAQLWSLAPWWRRHDREWVTFDKPDSISLLRDEKTVWAHHPTTRNLANLARNLRLAWRILRRDRPDVVVSNGAAVAFPFFLVARLLRVPRVYIEIYERFDSFPTLTGRLCYRLSDLFLLQWEEQRRLYPRGKVIGPLL